MNNQLTNANNTTEEIADQIKNIFNAVHLDAIQAGANVISADSKDKQTREWLKEIRKMAEKHDDLLIKLMNSLFPTPIWRG